MTTPVTGPISMSQVRQELGRTGSINMLNAAVRSLAGVFTGQIRMSDLRGKNLRGAEFITSSTTYTVPAGYTQLRMLLVSAGGSTGLGAGAGGGGGGGVATTSSFLVQAGDQLIMTVGEGSWPGRGGATSVFNPRTGITVSARQGFQGATAIALRGGQGGASFDEAAATYAGGVGAQGPYGGGGGGAGAVGFPASTSSVGLGAPARSVQLNTTQTVYLSPGGSGIGPILPCAPAAAITSNVGAGASYVGQRGGAGVIIIY
jgi:hypothetical protein